jgi:hypothetical protein
MRKIYKTTRQVIMALLVFSGIFLASSCEKYKIKVETISPTDSVFFQTDLQPVFTAKCILCHKGGSTASGLDLRTGSSYSSLSDKGLITPADSTCKLYIKINSGHPASLLDLDRQKILLWVKQGAHNN